VSKRSLKQSLGLANPPPADYSVEDLQSLEFRFSGFSSYDLTSAILSSSFLFRFADTNLSKMSLVRSFYEGVTKRTSTFALAMMITAFGFERGIDWAVDSYWNEHNKGKLWKDLKHKYEVQEEQ
jgi:ubiquinol-cytochrome c reductase subunit 9